MNAYEEICIIHAFIFSVSFVFCQNYMRNHCALSHCTFMASCPIIIEAVHITQYLHLLEYFSGYYIWNFINNDENTKIMKAGFYLFLDFKRKIFTSIEEN